MVHVVGEVRSSGLYRLRDGARIADAVHRAGGALRDAGPRGGESRGAARGRRSDLGSRQSGCADRVSSWVRGRGDPRVDRPVSLSSATLEELDQLPGVGPITAQKILDYRTEHGPFASVDDLDAVPGIGPTRIEQLRELVTP